MEGIRIGVRTCKYAPRYTYEYVQWIKLRLSNNDPKNVIENMEGIGISVHTCMY